MNKILKAIQFAVEKHGNQMYSETEPYLKHLMDVMAILQHYFPNDEELICAGILHDVLEDTDTTEFSLMTLFGPVIANIVMKVTNPVFQYVYEGEFKTIHRYTRKEKHEIQYPIIAQSEDAVIVKLADRIANVESGRKNDMYRKEHQFFKESLQTGRDMTFVERRMWKHLDSLLFPPPSPLPVELQMKVAS